MIAIADPIAALTPDSVNQVAIAALLTKQNQATDQDNTSTTAVGSQLTGGSIAVQSGRDALVKGSAIVADGDVSIIAGRDLTVTTAENSDAGHAAATSKTSGLLRFDATGNSVGKREQDQAQQNTATSHTASQIVSLGKGGESNNEGNVSLVATGNNTITGSSVMAPAGDIDITGASVLIDDAQNNATQASQTHARETAATMQLKSGYVEAIKGAYEAVQTARDAKQDTGSDRMAGLAAINAAISVYNAYQGISGSATAASQNVAPISAISLSSSVGISKSESDSSSSQSIAQGSQLAAGGALTIAANGDANAGSGNLTMIGANLTAGQAASLSATGHIDLLAAENTVQVHSTNSSSNASLGVTFALGGAQNGFSFQIGAQGARGLVNGEETTYSNTQIRVGSADSPGTLTIKSGGDTTLRGASASADRITTDIGGNLLIESLKDKIKYDSQQTSVGGGVSICVPPICYGQMVAVTVNASDAKIKADHDSVGAIDEAAQRGQSGLKAGNGGFDIKVGGNTTLIGGVITSADQAVNDNQNSFNTGGTLTTQDIHNQSELDATSVSASISTGSGSTGGSFGYGEVSDNQTSTTQAAISGIAGNQQARTSDAEAGIKPVFTEADAEKVNKSLSVQTGITAAFGQNAAKVVGDIAAYQMKPIADARAYEAIKNKQENGEALSPADQFQLATLEQDGMTESIAQSNLANPDLLQDYENWKEGGAYRIGLHVIVGAMGGGVNGAIGAGASAAAAPLLDEMQDRMTQSLIESGMNPETARATASLIAVGTAAAAGGIASGGIQGATTAANIDLNNRQLHISEQKLLRDKARELALRYPADQRAEAERYWYSLLTSEALAQVDAQAHVERDEYIRQLNALANDPITRQGHSLIPDYENSRELARSLIDQMSGQTILDTNGKPIFADGATLRTFQAIAQQYQDHDLFNAGMPYWKQAQQLKGGGNTPDSTRYDSSGQGNAYAERITDSLDQARLERWAADPDAIAQNMIDVDIATLGIGGIARNAIKTIARGAAAKEATWTLSDDTARALRRDGVPNDVIESLRASREMGYDGDIIVIGRKSDTIKFNDTPNHHVLDVSNEDWSIGLNNTWVSVAIARRAPIRLTSDLADNMWDFVKNRSTVFAQEYQQLMNAGYKHVGNYLLPPPK